MRTLLVLLTGLDALVLLCATWQFGFARSRTIRSPLEHLWKRYPSSYEWSAVAVGICLCLALVFLPAAAVVLFVRGG